MIAARDGADHHRTRADPVMVANVVMGPQQRRHVTPAHVSLAPG
jgi:hypothetical protein